jgi:hypothetical protein
MNTKELARTLTALAELADFRRSDGLYRLASFFENGKTETIPARLKRMRPATSHPSDLRRSLEIIRSGLLAAGAKKQASLIAAVLTLFTGSGGATLDRFLEEISAPPDKSHLAAERSKTADHQLARRIADMLNQSSLDASSFQDILTQLRSPHLVNTPTLALIANRYLGNDCFYRDRKKAIDAIIRHHLQAPMPADGPRRRVGALEGA